MRGPVLYCVEGVDYPAEDVRQFVLADGTQLKAEFKPDLLGGVTVLRGTVSISAEYHDWGQRLYRLQNEQTNNQPAPDVQMTAIPYYAWANRDAAPMLVWLRTKQD